ncbi:hypothetical protein D3C83_94810 [compost metagenome]
MEMRCTLCIMRSSITASSSSLMVLSSSPIATLTPALRICITGVMPLRMMKLQLGWLVTDAPRRPMSSMSASVT